MTNLAFFSNKATRELNKFVYIILIVVITWVLQLSVFSRFLYFDYSPNILLLGSIYFGLFLGYQYGAIFGILSSYLTSTMLYDHTFYITFPLIGFSSGLLVKYIFSEEILSYLLITILLSIPYEIINGLQLNSSNNSIDLSNLMPNILINSTILNLILSPIYYVFMTFITKKIKLR